MLARARRRTRTPPSPRAARPSSRWWIAAVVGVTPTGSTLSPRSAFTKVVLPWLNSPTTTRWKRSSPSLLHELAVDPLAQALGAERARHVAQPAQRADDLVPPLEEGVERGRGDAGAAASITVVAGALVPLDRSSRVSLEKTPRRATSTSLIVRPRRPRADGLVEQLALGEHAHGQHALGKPRVGREDLHVLADPLSALLRAARGTRRG